MKTFDQLIEAAADNYEFNEDGKGALMSPHHREGFITGAKFVSENPMMIESVRELVAENDGLRASMKVVADALDKADSEYEKLEAKLKFAEHFIKHNSGTSLDDWYENYLVEQKFDEENPE